MKEDWRSRNMESTITSWTTMKVILWDCTTPNEKAQQSTATHNHQPLLDDDIWIKIQNWNETLVPVGNMKFPDKIAHPVPTAVCTEPWQFTTAVKFPQELKQQNSMHWNSIFQNTIWSSWDFNIGHRQNLTKFLRKYQFCCSLIFPLTSLNQQYFYSFHNTVFV